jgi:hypothetical protein
MSFLKMSSVPVSQGWKLIWPFKRMGAVISIIKTPSLWLSSLFGTAWEMKKIAPALYRRGFGRNSLNTD